MQELDERMERFLTELASKAPIPGGGGAAALMGSLAAALGSMVGNLTIGKKKYEQYQQDIEHILSVLQDSLWEIYEYIEKDAQAFEPLAKAYKIPRDQPGREELMEEVTLQAAKIPLDLTKKLYEIIPLLEELEVKGSRLAISDVAVAASCLKAALESAVMNIYINTRSLKNRKLAEEINEEAKRMSGEGVLRCKNIYERILETLV